MTEIRVPIPEVVFRRQSVESFREFLGRENVEPRRADGIIESIVSNRIGELAQRYVATMRRQVIEVLHIRQELRLRYRQVVEHLTMGGVSSKLPPHLEPAAFDAMFTRLSEAMDRLEPPEKFLEAVRQAEAQSPLSRPWEDHPTERVLPPEEPLRPPEEVLTGLAEDAERYASGELTEADLERSQGHVTRQSEHLRAERARVRERFIEDPQVRARVETAAEQFADRHGLTARGWTVGITRVPRTGSDLAQLRFHSELDPVFAAEGYGITLRRPGPGGEPATGRARAGEVYKPDAVIQSPRGSGYAFGEFKEPLGPRERSFYDSPEGHQKLFEDMFERVQMSREMGPDCAGWAYDTGAEWLDQLIYDIANERLSPADAKRIMVPRAKEK